MTDVTNQVRIKGEGAEKSPRHPLIIAGSGAADKADKP